MELNATQTLAAWIVYSQRSGQNGPMFPPRGVMEDIVKHRADRYDEAEMMAAHFLQKVHTAAPANLEETVSAGMRFVQGVNGKLGGLLGTPPVKALIRGTRK